MCARVVVTVVACGFLLLACGDPPRTEDAMCAGDGGGACAESENGGGDGGLEDVSAAADPGFAAHCTALVDKTCGTSDPPECDDAPACAAARLLELYAPEQCQGAGENDVTYPACRPGSCALLVNKVCGGIGDGASCPDAPGCGPANELYERSRSQDAEERADAEASCNSALEDDVVFAACSPSR